MSNQVRFMGVNVTMKWLLCFVVLVLTAALLFPVLLEASAEKDAAIAEAEAAIDDIPDPVEMEDMMTIRIARHLVEAAFDLGAVESEIDNYADLVDAEEAVEALFSDDFFRQSILDLTCPMMDDYNAVAFIRNMADRWWEGHTVNGMCFLPYGSKSSNYGSLDEPEGRWARYDVSGRGYTLMKGYVGIDDESGRIGYPLVFQVLADDDPTPIYEANLYHGEYAEYYLVDIEDVDELVFKWFALDDTDGGLAEEFVFVEPQFFIPVSPELEDAVEDAEAAIAALPAELTYDDEEEVKAARALVNEAYELGVNKEYISNYNNLIAAEEAVNDLYYEDHILESLHLLGDPGGDHRNSGWLVSYDDPERWGVYEEPGTRGTVNHQIFAPLKVFNNVWADLDTNPRYAEWDISEHNYTYLEGYIGVNDIAAQAGHPINFTVYGDGEPLFETTAEYGRDAQFYRVNVEDVEWLKIEFSADPENLTPGGYVAWPAYVEPHFLVPYSAALAEVEEAIDAIPDPVSKEDMMLIRIARTLADLAIEGGAEASDISNYDDLLSAEEDIEALYRDNYMRQTIHDLDLVTADNDAHTIFMRTKAERWWEGHTINNMCFLPMGSVSINYTTIGPPDRPDGRWAEYDISGRGYTLLKGYAGINDLSLRHDYPTTFQVHADGDLIFEEVLEFGEYAAFYFLDIEGVEKIRFGWFAEVTDGGRANETVAVEPQFFKPIDQEMLDAIAAAEASINDLPGHISFVDEEQIKAARAVVQEAYDLGVEKEGRIANLDDLVAAEETVNDLYDQFFEKSSLLDIDNLRFNSEWPTNNIWFAQADRWGIHDEYGDMGMVNRKSYAPLQAFTGNWTLPRDAAFDIEGLDYVYFEGSAGIADESTRMFWPLEMRIYTDADGPDDDPDYVSPPLYYGQDAVHYRIYIEGAETLHFLWDAPWGYDGDRGNTPSFAEPMFLHSPKTAEAITAAEDAIDNLPDLVDITEGDRDDLDAARAKVNNALFIGVEEGDIPNLDELEAAEARLENMDILPGLIADAIAAIDDLPDPADVTFDDMAPIQAARALVEDVLALGAAESEITNLDVLVAVEEAFDALEIDPVIVSIDEVIGFDIDDTVMVPVTVADALKMAGGEMVVEYDPDIATPVSLEKGALLEALEIEVGGIQNSVILEGNFAYSPNSFKVVWVSGISLEEAGAAGEGVLFYIEFEINSVGETALAVDSLEAFDSYEAGVREIPAEGEDGKIEIQEVVFGDLNSDGKINVIDVIMAMQHVLDLVELEEGQQRAADVNGDGVIDIDDITLIMQRALNLITEFPVE